MKVHEYQAKALLSQYGIPIPLGKVAFNPAEAREVAANIEERRPSPLPTLFGKGRVVIKAQVHAGGRGKAGGIKIANTLQEAETAARWLIGTRLVTLTRLDQKGCQ